MTATALEAIERLACPRCRGALAAGPTTLTCGACGAAYPLGPEGADLLPWTGGDPGPEWARWKRKLDRLQVWRRETWAGDAPAGADGEKTDDAAARFFSFLDAPREGHALEIGCGDGGMRRHLPGMRFHGLDPLWGLPGSPGKAPPEDDDATFVRGVGERLPFANRGFDLVLLSQTLDHCFSASQTLDEAWRVLRPDGRLAVMQSLRAPDPPLWRRLRIRAGRLKARLTGHDRVEPADTKVQALDRATLLELLAPRFRIEAETLDGTVAFVRARPIAAEPE